MDDLDKAGVDEADVTDDLDEIESNSELSCDDDIVRIESDMLECSEFLQAVLYWLIATRSTPSAHDHLSPTWACSVAAGLSVGC